MDKLPWISVLDSLPPAGEDVLFWATFSNIVGGAPCFGYKKNDDDTDILWCDKTESNCEDDPIEVTTVTHWLKVTPP